MTELVAKAGGDAQYTEVPDVGHTCWFKAFDTPGLLDWLFAQKRPEQPPASPNKDIWLYIPFNGALTAQIPSGGQGTVEFQSRDDKPAEYVEGIHGKALRVTEENQAQFSFFPRGRLDFPFERGAVLIWIRPEKDLEQKPSFMIYEGGQSRFQLENGGRRLISYATDSPQGFIAADLPKPPAPWKDQWHLIVTTWDGPKGALYLDGRLIGHNDTVAPLMEAPYQPIHFGYMAGGRGSPASQFLDGAVAEFAILKAPLDAAGVATLYKQGKDGLLSALGGTPPK
jgi:hypothetical protein